MSGIGDRIRVHTGDITKLQTIAPPAISTGIYRFPKEEATQIAVGVASTFLEQNTTPETVIFCCFDEPMPELYRQAVAAFGGA